MATILSARSWDCGNSMLNTVDASEPLSVNSTYKKTGAYSLRITCGASRWVRWAISGTPANPSVSMWVYTKDVFEVSNSLSLRFLLGTGEYIEARWNGTTHTLDAYVDNVLVASGTVEVSVNNWFHVQFYAVVANAGSIGIKIDGFQSVNYSGDTQPGVATGAAYLYNYSISGTDYAYFDDLVWGYGGYLGNLECYDHRPTADTAQDDWTPSAGDNYSTTNETPPNDATHNETNINGHADELALADFDGSDKTPVAVIAWVRAWMVGATGDSIKVGIDSAGTDDVTEHALSTAKEYYFHTADDNPADAAEWEDADIDALLHRYEGVIA